MCPSFRRCDGRFKLIAPLNIDSVAVSRTSGVMGWISRRLALLIGSISSAASVLYNKPRKKTLAVSMGHRQIAITNERGHLGEPEIESAEPGAV